MSEISEMYQELVRDFGDEVSIQTVVCVMWKNEHENCVGCQSELGCAKAAGMMGASMEAMLYEPKSYTDYELMQKSIQSKLDGILKAKTVEEVHTFF